MGKYTELSSEGGRALRAFGFTFLTQLPRVWLSLFPMLMSWDECAI